MPVISISEKCDLCKECIDVCPRGMFKVEKNKLVATDVTKCSLCKLCSEACDTGAITVSTDNTSFIYTVETDGSYSAQDIIVRAAQSIKGRAEQLGDILENF